MLFFKGVVSSSSGFRFVKEAVSADSAIAATRNRPAPPALVVPLQGSSPCSLAHSVAGVAGDSVTQISEPVKFGGLLTLTSDRDPARDSYIYVTARVRCRRKGKKVKIGAH